MTASPLHTLLRELPRLLAAGAAAARADERLGRLRQQLLTLARRVPAADRLAEAMLALQRATDDRVAVALLELLRLTRQAAVGLLGCGVAGPLEPAPASGPWHTPARPAELDRLWSSITGTWLLDEDELDEALQRGTASDLRLVLPMLRALRYQGGNIHRQSDPIAEKLVPSFGRGVLPELEAALNLQGDENDALRLQAICRIDAEAGLAYCRRALTEGSKTLQAEAITQLGKLDGAESEAVALQFCYSEDNDVWLNALLVLTRSASTAALDVLMDQFRRPGTSYSAGFLRDFPHPDTTPRLLRELEERLRTLEAAEQALAAARKPTKKAALPAAKGARRSKSPEVETVERARSDARRRVEDVIGLLGERKDNHEAIARALVPLTQHPARANPRDCTQGVALKVVYALCKIGAATDDVVPALIALLDSPTHTMVEAAASALNKVEPVRRAPAIPKLLEMMQQPGVKDSLRREVNWIVPPHFAEHPRAIADFLSAGLQHPASWFQGETIESLGRVGPAAREFLPALLRMLEEGTYFSPTHYRLPKTPLCMIDPEGTTVIPRALEVLKTANDWQTRVRAAITLSHYGPKAKAAAPVLRELLARGDAFAKFDARPLLEQIEGADPGGKPNA